MIAAALERLRTALGLYLPQAKPYLPHAAALLFFGLLGWFSGYFQSAKTVENPHLKETWSVPNWTPYHAGEARAQFAASEIWDGKKSKVDAKQAAPPKQTWDLVGTVRTGKTYAAVIQFSDTGRVRRAVPGDLLPNGEKIVAVQNGTLQIDIGGMQQEIKLFQHEPEKK